jgi:serine protease Do
MLTLICLLSPARPSLSQIPEFSGAKMPMLVLLVREVTPSVVNLSVHGRIKDDNPLYRDPPFREYFGVPMDREREFQAVGSGVSSMRCAATC